MFCLFMSVVEAQSADSVSSLNEVVVTAQKREEPLGKIPIAVTAFTSSQVHVFRLWNNKDISGVVPGLYAADPGDGRDVISIRGVTSTSYDPLYVEQGGNIGVQPKLVDSIDIGGNRRIVGGRCNAPDGNDIPSITRIGGIETGYDARDILIVP